jgi:hypothetical protein
MELILGILIVLVALAWLVRARTALVKQQELERALEIFVEEANKLLIVTLETVKQDQYQVVLVHDYNTDRFLCQGADLAECEKLLTTQFPGSTIMVFTKEKLDVQ